MLRADTYHLLVPKLALGCLRRLVVFPSSVFQQIIDEPPTLTSSVFQGKPLAAITPKRRGDILARIVRSVDSDMHPNSHISDAIPGVDVNGFRRGRANAEYDWVRDTFRIECKSAQLQWDKYNACWRFCFQAIKRSLFDELYLAFYTPQHVHIYRHDLNMGFGRTGKHVAEVGFQIQFAGPRQEQSWDAALGRILAKIDSPANDCERIADLPLDDNRIAHALAEHSSDSTAHVYSSTPLASLTPSARGVRIQEIVRALDSMLHLDVDIRDALGGRRTDGIIRSQHHATYDWDRNGIRVECKSSQLCWSRLHLCWSVVFRGIKLGEFDELLLTVYSPRGLHVYKHKFTCRVVSVGKITASAGYQICMTGAKHERDWSVALDTVLNKLERAGCGHVGQIGWCVGTTLQDE